MNTQKKTLNCVCIRGSDFFCHFCTDDLWHLFWVP